MDDETKKLLTQIIDAIFIGSIALWFIAIDLFVMVTILSIKL